MRPDAFFDEHQDILESIEMNVIAYYREHPSLTDYHVEKIYNGLQRTFEKELQDRKPPKLRFNELEQDLFDIIEDISRFFVGEAEVEIHEAHDHAHETEEQIVQNEDEESDEELLDSIEPVSKEVIVKAMKRLRGSIKTWTGKVQGKRGYLDYISQYL